ncbi:MAG: hypothetical protein WCF85_19035, partial [Rhodospirillaceae bacterium]
MTTGRVLRASTSAGLFVEATGEPIGDAGGCHLYLCVKDGADIERALKVLAMRLWLGGFDWVTLSRSGAALIRQPAGADESAGVCQKFRVWAGIMGKKET